LQEVARVLRPGGYFLYADFRFHDEQAAWELALATAPLELVRAQVISAEVRRGLDRNADRSLALVNRRLPKWLHSLGRDFAGIPGSRVYRALQDGGVVYHSYCYLKPLTESPVSDGASAAVK
jgi:SAM-dependent methyltransferase